MTTYDYWGPANRGHQLRMVITVSQNAAGNYSDVRCVMYLSCGQWVSDNRMQVGQATDGVQKYWWEGSITYNAGLITLSDTWHRVWHNAAGERSVTFTGGVYAANTGYVNVAINVNNLTLPKIVPPTSVPVATYSPVISEITKSSIKYQFTGGSTGGLPILRYEAQHATNASFTGAVTNSNWGTYTPTRLSARTTYYFRSRGVNEKGAGPWGAVTNATTIDVPTAPTVTVSTRQALSLAGSLTTPGYTGGSITGWQTQLSTNASFSGTPEQTAVRGWTFTGLARNTRYYLRARAQNSQGWGPWSAPFEVSTLVELPGAPVGYMVTDVASTTAYVTQPGAPNTGGSPIVNVRAQVSTSASETGAVVVTEGGYRPTLLQDLTPGTTYYVRLAVQNSGDGSGWGPYGEWVSFTTRSDVPTAPQSLVATATGETTGSASWTAPADMLGSSLLSYTVRLAADPSFATGLVIKSVTDLSTTFDGLQKGTKYYVQVMAASTNGNGSFSSIESFTTDGIAPTPDAAWMRVAGAWRSGKLWLRVDGTWRLVTPWTRVDGVWRKYG